MQVAYDALCGLLLVDHGIKTYSSRAKPFSAHTGGLLLSMRLVSRKYVRARDYVPGVEYAPYAQFKLKRIPIHIGSGSSSSKENQSALRLFDPVCPFVSTSSSSPSTKSISSACAVLFLRN